MKHFSAPWSVSLILVSVLATALLAGASIYAWRETRVVAAVCASILLGAALFTVRGYTIVGHLILVHRLLWATSLPRGPIVSAIFDPKLLRSSLKLFGNGGLFSFTGWYWNRRLGCYRGFVTDPRRTVVVRYPNRTVVLSPEFPQEFISALEPARRPADLHG